MSRLACPITIPSPSEFPPTLAPWLPGRPRPPRARQVVLNVSALPRTFTLRPLYRPNVRTSQPKQAGGAPFHITPEFIDATDSIFGCRIPSVFEGVRVLTLRLNLLPRFPTRRSSSNAYANLRGLVPAHTKLFCPLNLYY